MQQIIPDGHYNLVILMAEKFLSVFTQTCLIHKHGIAVQDLTVFEDSEKPYFEVNIEHADISDVVNSLINHDIEADIQVLPLYQDENYKTSVGFNAFVRDCGDQTLCYINSKEEEEAAAELQSMLANLNANGIHEADTLILARINELHSVGWVC